MPRPICAPSRKRSARSRSCRRRRARSPGAPAGRVQTALIDEQRSAVSRCVVRLPAGGAWSRRPSNSLRPTLRELWRVLTPAGRLIVVAPNRASLWAQLETSPFGHGQPYTRGQLERLLVQSLFQPEAWDSALFMPPFGGRRSIRTGNAWERIGPQIVAGSRGCPHRAGVEIDVCARTREGSAPSRACARDRGIALARRYSRARAGHEAQD